MSIKGQGRGWWKDHHSKVCRRTEPRLNRSTPAIVQVLPPVGTAALHRSSLQQEVFELTGTTCFMAFSISVGQNERH